MDYEDVIIFIRWLIFFSQLKFENLVKISKIARFSIELKRVREFAAAFGASLIFKFVFISKILNASV